MSAGCNHRGKNLTYRPTNDTTYLTGNEGHKFVRFSLKMLRCRARELSACASRPFFIKMRMRIELQGPEKLRGDSLETTAFGGYGVKQAEKPI